MTLNFHFFDPVSKQVFIRQEAWKYNSNIYIFSLKWSVSSKPTTAFAIKRGASLNNLKSDFGKTLWFCAMGHLQKGMHIRCIYIGLRP